MPGTPLDCSKLSTLPRSQPFGSSLDKFLIRRTVRRGRCLGRCTPGGKKSHGMVPTSGKLNRTLFSQVLGFAHDGR